MAKKKKMGDAISIPAAHDWRTTDDDEINRRRLRAQSEDFAIRNLDARNRIFSNFQVRSGSGFTYSVEIRDLAGRQFSCECVDFRINGLGTCKHVEAVLLHLERRYRRLYRLAMVRGSDRIDLMPDPDRETLRIQHANGSLPGTIRKWFDGHGLLRGLTPEEALERLLEWSSSRLPALRISQEVAPWLEQRRRIEERKRLRHEYELKVQCGEWPAQETLVPLFPYQREGMLHLAFAERAMLADEMGLGKTIQAIAACALLHRLGQARHVLVVTPASLKSEWEEQIQRFTPLPYQIIFGNRSRRLRAYDAAPFFTIVNYEQMLADSLEVNARLQPDIVVLDEAQRIKNWNTKTSQAVKRLQSRYAFVLTGTPIENRIDELHSLMDFLDPSVLGPLFRFNREFYQLNDRGRPSGYQNLDRLHQRIRPYLVRRRKADVETELPERSDRNHFVTLSASQRREYKSHEHIVAGLFNKSKSRHLTQQEQDKLMRHLAMMRMICDTNYILDDKDLACPKLDELETIFEECRENTDVKVIVFSEWERMLHLVRGLCETLGLGYAWHTGSVPQQRRRGEINTFKNNPDCRVFLSTDSGASGLNLQNASVVINCDLPWNPAKLEQRIARAWRKHQKHPVTVVNLVAEGTIEHRMLFTLANKRALSDGVLDHLGDLDSIQITSGRQAFLARLEQVLTAPVASPKPVTPSGPTAAQRSTDRAMAFSRHVNHCLAELLCRCEERYPANHNHSVLYVVVEGDAAAIRPRLEEIHREWFGPDQDDSRAPVHLEVVDRATDAALRRMADAGLITLNTRACRTLFPESETESPTAGLTDNERHQIHQQNELAARKLKMARLLGEGGLGEEIRPPLLEAILATGRALAIENHFPEPNTPETAVLPPISLTWEDALAPIRDYVQMDSSPWLPAADALHAALMALQNRSEPNSNPKNPAP